MTYGNQIEDSESAPPFNQQWMQQVMLKEQEDNGKLLGLSDLPKEDRELVGRDYDTMNRYMYDISSLNKKYPNEPMLKNKIFRELKHNDDKGMGDYMYLHRGSDLVNYTREFGGKEVYDDYMKTLKEYDSGNIYEAADKITDLDDRMMDMLVRRHLKDKKGEKGIKSADDNAFDAMKAVTNEYKIGK